MRWPYLYDASQQKGKLPKHLFHCHGIARDIIAMGNLPAHARIKGLSQGTTLGEIIIERTHEAQHDAMDVVACVCSYHVRDAC